MTEKERDPVLLRYGSRRRVRPDGLSKRVTVSLPPPSLADNRGDAERLGQSLGEAQIPPDFLRACSGILRRADWRVTATLGWFGGRWRLTGLEPGDAPYPHLGLAVDLGTTTVVAYLVDLGSGRVVDAAAAYNGQAALGEDILTRIQTGSDPKGLSRLRAAALDTVNGLIRRLAAGHAAAAVVAGNTAMIHFLLGLDPGRICLAPYIPAANRPGTLAAAEAGLAIAPTAPVYFVPGVGSYVGGDVVAGVLASGLHRRRETALFVDIGTNGEMVLGCRDWLVACAGAAGPALEGGVAGAGMRAAPGAIERVAIDPASGRVRYAAIGGGPPRGLCGSGLVDAMAQLLLAGIIDRSGRFRDGRPSFVVAPAGETAAGRDIVITQTDLDNLLRTKGAVGAALEYLLESVGLPLGAVERFYAAGAFGQYLPLESAVTIGLYPDLERRRMVRLGNSAGEGARLILVSRRKLREAEAIAGRITYFELNASDVFMRKFVGSRFLPHTDLYLFPSVRKKFEERGLI